MIVGCTILALAAIGAVRVCVLAKRALWRAGAWLASLAKRAPRASRSVVDHDALAAAIVEAMAARIDGTSKPAAKRRAPRGRAIEVQS